MNNKLISLEPFTEKYFSTYLSWFSDPETNRFLGPMTHDDPFFDHIQNSSDSVDFAAVVNGKMVGEIGVTLPTMDYPYFVINQIVVNPALRGKGLSQAIIEKVQSYFATSDIKEWRTYIDDNNVKAKKVFTNLGWRLERAEDGMVEFREG